MEESFEVENPLITNQKKADLKLARNHQKASKARNLRSYKVTEKSKLCPCCSLPIDAPYYSLCCSIEKLGDLGIGVPLYFYFVSRVMLWLAWSFIFAGAYCAYQDYNAGHSGDWGKGSESWYIDASLGGFGKDEDIPEIQGILHAANSVILVIFFFFLRKSLTKMIQKIDKNHITPSDYTVWVKNLRNSYNSQDLKAFFEKQTQYFGFPSTVESVSVAYDINQYVKDTREHAKLKGLLLFIQDYQKKHHGNYPKKGGICCKCKNYIAYYPLEGVIKQKIDYLEKRIHKFEQKAKESYNQTHYAFVTFTKEEDAKMVVDYWAINPSTRIFCCLCMFCYDGPFTFKKVRLHVEQAPEPSDIIWENLSASSCQKYIRRLITTLWTLALLIGCFILVYITKQYQRSYYRDYENKPKDERTYQDLLQVRLYSFGLSVCILIINRFLAIVVRIFSKTEKHITWTHYHRAVTNKLVTAMVLNSVAILIWVNSGKIDDWFLPYGLVNDVLFLLIVSAISSPLTYIFSPLYLYKVHKRRQVRKLARRGIIGITQIEANKLWENPEVDMAQRYANILVTLIICFIFAPLFPLCFFIGFISVFLQYWTDKLMLLRRHSRPRNFGKGMSNNMLKWIPLFILAYSGSNCVFLFFLKSEDYHNILIPIAAFLLVALFFILPIRFLSGLKSRIRKRKEGINVDERNEYEENAVHFNEDYMRNNPLLAKEGWKDWLKLVEHRKGTAEKKKMETRFSNVMNAASNPRNYAYQMVDLESGQYRTIAENPFSSVMGGSVINPVAGNPFMDAPMEDEYSEERNVVENPENIYPYYRNEFN